MVLPLSRALFLLFLSAFVLLPAAPARSAEPFAAARFTSSPGYRFEKGGWTYVHLEGTPAEIGFQHGQLLPAEIQEKVGGNIEKWDSVLYYPSGVLTGKVMDRRAG